MSNYLTVLIGDQASTKHYTIDADTDRPLKGKVKTSYLHDSYTVPVSNLADLYEALASVRSNPNAFIIRGRGREDMMTRVRRTKDDPANFYEQATQWICFDFDSLMTVGDMSWDEALKFGNDECIYEIIRNYLPKEFQFVDFIYQWSSSAGLYYKDQPVKEGINIHLFFWLNRAVTDQELKAWFKHYKEPAFDLSVFRTITPIFVGNHIVRDERIIDCIPDDEKFGILEGRIPLRKSVQVPEIDTNVLEQWLLDSMTMPEDNVSEILQQLYTLGAIYKSTGAWYKLKHPAEKTPGDWHIRKTDPKVVHHHAHNSKRIDRWIKDFYGVDATFKLPQEDAVITHVKKFVKYSQDQEDIRALEKRIKELKNVR